MTNENAYSESDLQRTAHVRRVTWWGLLVNILLAGLKFVCGIVGHSQAVVADAFHSLSDLGTDVAVLVGARYWSQPADATHPHGHGRIETAITTLLGLMLTVVGIGIAWQSLVTLHDRHMSGDAPRWIAFWAAVLSIASKEWLYRWTARVGRQIKSQAVIANAWHHRSDSLSSYPAAISVAWAAVSPDWRFLDHIGALIVSLFILQAAWRIVVPAFQQLIDTGAKREDREALVALALGTRGVKAVHALRTRHIGPGLQVDIHVLVEPALSVRDGHIITGAVKRRLLQAGPDVVDVLVHLEPYEEAIPKSADPDHER